MLNSLKLRTRILLGYSVPLLLSVGFAAVVSYHTQSVQQKVDADAAKQKVLATSERIVYGFSEMQRYSASFMLNPDDDFLMAYEKGVQLFEESAESLDRHVDDSQQQARLDRIRQLGNQIDILNRYLMSLAQANKSDQAIRAFAAAESRTLSADLTQVLEDWVAAHDRLERTPNQATQTAIQALNQGLWMGSVALTIAGIAVSVYLAQHIADTLDDRITSLKNSSKEITHGVLSSESAFSRQVETLSQTTAILEDLSQSSDRYASQTTSATVQVEGIENKIQSLQAQITQMYELANRVSNLAAQTNLLALQAGLEAIRPSGRCDCFDGVATKIRSLASEGQKSAQQVNALIADIERGTNSAVAIPEAGTKNFESLWMAIAAIAITARTLSQQSQEQSSTLRQAIEAMNERYRSAQDVTNTIRETQSCLKKLNIAANHLQDLL